MRRLFFLVSFFLIGSISVVSLFWRSALWALVPVLPIVLIGAHNALQKKKAILRNYPLLGIFRYLFEAIRPEIQQYFVESDTDGTPVSRYLRSVVYQRAKQQNDTVPFGTQLDVYAEGYEWISHSLSPKKISEENLRVQIGGPACRQPYSASIFNISAMSYGALSKNAIQALNGGAKLGGFYHNTGEGGVSLHHLSEEGDLVWQIGTGYFGCRTTNGEFCEKSYQETARKPVIKMIEIKLSQGAKPAHGGILPAAKITPEVMKIRGVPAGKDVISPPSHSAFKSPMELLEFVQRLRDLSGGKPIGLKMCIGDPSEFIAICKAMKKSGILPDYIVIDGSEGGTGAAPLEFSNNVGTPLTDALSFAHDILRGFDLRKDIRLIASGKILTGFNILTRMTLGADLCNSARGMMLALGCIQARHCNTNRCPTGVATSDPSLTHGLVVGDKKVRVYNYHKSTVHAFAELLGAVGLDSPAQLARRHVLKRMTNNQIKSYEDLYPTVETGAFIKGNTPERYTKLLATASADCFQNASEIFDKAM